MSTALNPPPRIISSTEYRSFCNVTSIFQQDLELLQTHLHLKEYQYSSSFSARYVAGHPLLPSSFWDELGTNWHQWHHGGDGKQVGLITLVPGLNGVHQVLKVLSFMVLKVLRGKSS